MMGVRIVIYALLMVSLQHAVGEFNQSLPSNDGLKIERAGPSHHHQRRFLKKADRWFRRLFKRQKKKDENKTQFSSNMRWEKNFENAFFVIDKDNFEYYIARDKGCRPCFCGKKDVGSMSECLYYIEMTEKKGKEKCAPDKFLVNTDDFEILEWKKVSKGKLPLFSVETCDGYFIAQHEKGLGYMTEKSKKIRVGQNKYDTDIKVLTLNFDITEEYLTNVQFNDQSVHKNRKPAMFRKFTVVNNNCQPIKQQVEIYSGLEETTSRQTDNSILIEGTFGLKVLKTLEFGAKTESTFSETETNSNTKKSDHGYSQEIEIPPASSCNLVISSSVFETQVSFTADLTRVYNNSDIHTTAVNGSYNYQNSVERKTNFQNCNKLSVKC